MEETIYSSNLFKSTKEMNYKRFPCLKLNLTISEDEAWRKFKQNKVSIPYYIAGNSIYYTDPKLTELDFLEKITKGNSKK